MKRENYLSMLRSLDAALQICRESVDKLDEDHRRLCAELSEARDRLLRRFGLPPNTQLGTV